MKATLLTIVLAPLIAAAIAGLFGKRIGRAGAHWITILAVGLSFGLSAWVLWQSMTTTAVVFDDTIYTWMVSDGLSMEIGFLVDRLTALMMTVVTFVSWMVHIYTVGYMREDPGYQRFFSYIALFTFAMLMLVMANNFLQLFFGWEAVGLVSYLLIGFWYKKPTAIHANLKAFIVNRVGDFGFLLAIASIVYFTGSLNYGEVFAKSGALTAGRLEIFTGQLWPAITVTCILLFVGAMGKSAQIPLHVWLPDSMEGPTPISALIHAATMVTAGIFMVARMSPLYELSEVALSTVLLIGATTAFLMGLVGVVQNDIKRIIAYSTLSQLGYMFVALGASAYGAGIFHLMTHAFFKALLFLAAGSVIIGMHHEQDIRKMGGLRKYMPITYLTMLVGTLALIGFPGFAGFYSKDAIIEAVHLSTIPGHGIAYFAVLSGVFVTALYSFRLLFVVFHGKERFDDHTREHLKESPWVVTLPLILLAIPSVIIGALTVGPLLFGGWFGSSLQVLQNHDVLAELGHEFHGPMAMVTHGLQQWPVWLAAAGALTAWFLYVKRSDLPAVIAEKLSPLYRVLDRKYYFDEFNQQVFSQGAQQTGRLFWRIGDETIIDGSMVNGTAKAVGWFSGVIRGIQTGFLYHYAFAMVIGLAALLGWLILAG
ncbi:MAG: NADH-quinone oxidoreductase subunit L [Gammaproteobacteria bacterium]|nr:NADH-quinone oxidoreductase subunit L [Gammaproteobacteria bacterium]MDH3767680.1 NADH-quinone oxidoreductase subunit L [Gammaproteobacteria bacterium]